MNKHKIKEIKKLRGSAASILLAISLLASAPMNTYATEMGSESSSYSSVASTDFSYENTYPTMEEAQAALDAKKAELELSGYENIVCTITEEEGVGYEDYNTSFATRVEAENYLEEYLAVNSSEVISSEIIQEKQYITHDSGEKIYDSMNEVNEQKNIIASIYGPDDRYRYSFKDEGITEEETTYTDGEPQIIYERFDTEAAANSYIESLGTTDSTKRVEVSITKEIERIENADYSIPVEETVYIVSGRVTPIIESKGIVTKYKFTYLVERGIDCYTLKIRKSVKIITYKLAVTANKIVEKEPEIEPTKPTEIPTEPTKPTEPTEVPTEPIEAPTEPTEVPTEPIKKPEKPNKKPKKDCTNPKTGDDSHINEYLVSMGLSLAGISVLGYQGIKEKKKTKSLNNKKN